ncbi:S8 family serine peptidase [Thioalkalivibrio sp. ALR17-21]|uniref:S8 family serine peptidase n=1 Tax=Thioalkalivibrio sp. ALR17-21 TaxID=1269813 RepID=UPI001E304FA0|nr:S8 family serine peptidase [Thioalkalivibrio sp. ALR17-21]
MMISIDPEFRDRFRPTFVAVAVSAAIVALSGCASSGGSSSNGGGGGSDNGEEEDTRVLPTYDQQAILDDDGDTVEVQVAVIDTEFRPSHEEFDGRVSGTKAVAGYRDSVEATEDDDGNPDYVHGTPVAALLGGQEFGISGNARMELIAAANEDGVVFGGQVVEGIAHAVEEGARVINASLSGQWSAWDRKETVGHLQEVTYEKPQEDGESQTIEVGTAGVVGAGNDGSNLSEDDGPDDPYIDHEGFDYLDEVWEQILIAGGSRGWKKNVNSNYPGQDEEIQDRFLVAPYTARSATNTDDDAEGMFNGTSFATPRIAGMVTGIIAQWPHLDASEATGRLLETASQESELYEENDCGPNEDLNCGYYYLGQGHADFEAALEPKGDVVQPAGEQVEDDESHDVQESYASWSHAFGNGFQADEELFDGAVAFDELGRDYRVDLSGHHAGGFALDTHVRQRLETHLGNASVAGDESIEIAEGVSMAARHADSGELLTGRFDMDFDGTRVSAFGFQGGEENPMETVLEGADTAMLSSTTPQFTHSLDDVAGVAAEVGLTDTFSVSAEYWSGRSDEDPAERMLSEDTVGLSDYGVDRQDVALHMQATDELRLSLGQGMLREDNGMLGSRGYGALNLGDEHELHVTSFGAEYAVSDRLSVTGQYEYGQGRMDGGAGMIRSIDNLRTEQATLGVAWDGDDHQVALMANQPMRVTGGEIEASVPVGRTVDGEVVREDRTASIGTDGRQTDIELGYSFMPDRDSRFNANLLYMDQPNHDPNASGEWAGAVTYAVRF